jgi:hypothetical protein
MSLSLMASLAKSGPCIKGIQQVERGIRDFPSEISSGLNERLVVALLGIEDTLNAKT